MINSIINNTRSNRQVNTSPNREQIKSLEQYPQHKINVDYDHNRFKAVEYEFRLIDKDQNGQLSAEEIQLYMKQKLGGEYDPNLVAQLFNELNTNNDQLISRDEFSHGYIKTEANLRQLLQGIERSIYEDQQQLNNIDKEMSKIPSSNGQDGQIGQIRVIVQNGCFVKKYSGKLTNAEKSKIQLEVQISCEEALERLKNKSTKTSLNCEYPLWGDKFSFYILNTKDQCQINFEIKEHSKTLNSTIAKLDIAKDIKQSFDTQETIKFEDVGEIQILVQFIREYIKVSIDNKYQEAIQVKRKLFYYSQLFGNFAVVSRLDGRIGIKQDKTLSQIEEDYQDPMLEYEQPNQELTKSLAPIAKDQSLQCSLRTLPIPILSPPTIKQPSPQTPTNFLQAFGLTQKILHIPFTSENTKLVKLRKFLLYLIITLLLGAMTLFRADYLCLFVTLLMLPFSDSKWNPIQVDFTFKFYALSILLDFYWLFVFSNCNTAYNSPQCRGEFGITVFVWPLVLLLLATKVGFLILLRYFEY